jgi:hypothetical protein
VPSSSGAAYHRSRAATTVAQQAQGRQLQFEMTVGRLMLGLPAENQF